MQTPEVKINLSQSTPEQVVVVRTGEALPLQEPVALEITGTIDTVARFLQKRYEGIKSKLNNVVVCRDSKTICLTIDENNSYGGEITGKLEMSTEFIKFGINASKKYSTRDLSDFIKMNRIYFTDREKAMKLVEVLRNYKGKIQKELEKSEDKRGNANFKFDQVVNSNVPEDFTLKIPVFKGHQECTFKVEINIIPRDMDVDCYLESVEANEIILDQTNKIIDDQIKEIQKLAPEIVIIET